MVAVCQGVEVSRWGGNVSGGGSVSGGGYE